MKINQLVKYVLITYIISWSSWGLLVYLTHCDVIAFSSPIGFILFGIGGFGPAIAAVAVLEKHSPKAVAKFLFTGNHKAVTYLLLFCTLMCGAVFFSSRELKVDAGIPLYLFPIVIIVNTLVGGGLEELGWRGIMQPFLERKMLFPFAATITGITWAVWHLPLWFIEGSPQHSLPYIGYILFCLALSFGFAAIHKKSNCVLYSSIFHGFVNTVTAYFVADLNWILALGGVIMIAVALSVWYFDKRKAVKQMK